ncbi:hypothetical protein EPD60_10870 [Flaviaesturariibacter flavus]|uniref:AAA+ ATPase domain-containing protein n=1 Tax=Flaviaesturariibacter flavus TaxID=2502780 RepID=A0A4V2NVS1_9BACT|nr:hypothetical protein [Flaviaesturariibacter flavus]TCJ14482.1 hypothetical protein EPD60_10870 [Flaviaesturariibacter flavus]
MVTFLYNPDRKPKDQLISEFVVRTRVYEQIMDDLESSEMKHPEQHYLLVGQRGAGKTTMLNRIKYGVEDSSTLQNRLIPVLFNEEQYHVSQLSDLWESVAAYLEDYFDFRGLSASMETHSDASDFEEHCFDLLRGALNKAGQTVLLLIDNIGDLLKRFDEIEVRRFREILQTANEIRLIAGSPFYLENILDYQQPLFEFFKVIRLDGLTVADAKEMLLVLGKLNDKESEIRDIIKHAPEKIATLVTLTGGVPRTIALMFNIFIEYNNEDTVKDLERILDAVTPLYKHRMDDLPRQQQKIVDVVAKNWDGIFVNEIAAKTKIESKIISAQLRQLEKNQIIEKRRTDTKNHLYFLKERFFNVWYLMRYGRKTDRQRVIWLVRFLECWCSPEELEIRIVDFISKMKNGTISSNTADFYCMVYSQVSRVGVEAKFLIRENVPVQIAEVINISNEDVLGEAKKALDVGDFNKVLRIFEKNNHFDDSVKLIMFDSVQQSYNNSYELNVYGRLFERMKSSSIGSDGNLEVEMSQIEFYVFQYRLFISLIQSIFANDLERVATLSPLFVRGVFEYVLPIHRNKVVSDFEYGLVSEFLIFLLARGYYNVIRGIYNSHIGLDLKEQMKPIYFAFLKLADGGVSLEYKKMATELELPVETVLGRVAERQKEIDLSLKTENNNGK